ncbi:protein arginine kinase [Schnuerera sp. xch1]|uniref:protein arginine kinase n=1 Tax=Schnuerera sp. xch1 TaxID=2874283 RepID=UPI001CBDF9E0|nr:protein arginine kinase [Schnuerera sp. xch1]MBZ2175201.1 protein arginine kinase [Schnuerera sp. xch1]
MVKWVEGTGLEEDVVVSTRIRIARNLTNYRFPQKMDIKEADKLTQEVLNVMKDLSDDVNYKFLKINSLTPVERVAYIEEHLISPGLLQKSDYSSFLLKDNENITIMINEEDHLRVQVLFPGLNFEEGWKLISKMDDFLESSLDYAYHDRYGYLTACPTNVGTGLRASAMVHIPSLTLTGHVDNLIRGFSKIGLTVRGLYGEGTEAIGDLYQISNQMTLGENEEEIIRKLKSVIYQIINRERDVRNNLLEKRKNEIEDKIFRSLGTLRYARKMSSKEAMKHLSNVRLGKEMGIINDVDYKKIANLMIEIQPASIQRYASKELTEEKRDIIRANYIREKI